MLGDTAAQAVIFVTGLAERVMAAVGFGFNQAVFAVVGKTLITIGTVPLADVTPGVVGEAQVFPGLETVVWAQGLGGAQVAGRVVAEVLITELGVVRFAATQLANGIVLVVCNTAVLIDLPQEFACLAVFIAAMDQRGGMVRMAEQTVLLLIELRELFMRQLNGGLPAFTAEAVIPKAARQASLGTQGLPM